jgi:hypothetical protein
MLEGAKKSAADRGMSHVEVRDADAGRERIRAATVAAMAQFEVDGRLELPGLAR